MKRLWSKHAGFRRTAYGLAALLVVGTGAVLFLAYGWMPPEDRTDTPAYLQWMQANHFDGYVNAGNFRLHYLHEGSGEPVVLLPGGGAWIYDFRHVIAGLAPHYSVYAIDPPGDGYTTPLAQNPDYNRIYTLGSIDESLLGFMNQLHIPKAAFIGNSWGGGYALYFTEKHPERVSKYISLDGSGLNIPDTFFWQLTSWPAVGEAFTKLTATRGFIRQTLELLYGPGKIKVTDDMVQQYYVPFTFHANLISQWMLERNLDWSVTERGIPHMKTPTLLIWGKQDDINITDRYVPRWRRLDPRATIVVLDHAGHLVHWGQPDRVNQLILSFLAE